MKYTPQVDYRIRDAVDDAEVDQVKSGKGLMDEETKGRLLHHVANCPKCWKKALNGRLK